MRFVHARSVPGTATEVNYFLNHPLTQTLVNCKMAITHAEKYHFSSVIIEFGDIHPMFGV